MYEQLSSTDGNHKSSHFGFSHGTYYKYFHLESCCQQHSLLMHVLIKINVTFTVDLVVETHKSLLLVHSSSLLWLMIMINLAKKPVILGGLTCSTLDPECIWSQMPLTGNWLGRGGLPVRDRRVVTADDGSVQSERSISQQSKNPLESTFNFIYRHGAHAVQYWQMVMCSGYTGRKASFSMVALASFQFSETHVKHVC